MISIKELPKVELHLHLDCSLSFDVVQKLKPNISYEEYQHKLIAPSKCKNLTEYLERANLAIRLLQTEQSLRLATKDLFSQMERDKIVYAEIRFAPLEHTKNGLNSEQVVKCISDQMNVSIEETGIESNLILCTLRNYSAEKSLETAQLANLFKNDKVVGFDVAGDESLFPIDQHISAFKFAKEHGIQCTAHAGEAAGIESVYNTIQKLTPSRIGHGVRAVEDPELMCTIKEKGIHLEICPSSNIQTNVFSTIKDHPINQLYQSGVALSINTDSRTLTRTTLNTEYQLLIDNFKWGLSHFKQCNMSAIKHSFASEHLKEKMKELILYAYTP